MTINPILLDPDVEGWVDEGIEQVRSNTDLTAFDVHSPERAFVELMVYERERLVESINKVPRQLLIDILNYIGFGPRSGIKATGEVTFTISVQTSDFSIARDYALTDGTRIYYTTETLTIPSGSTEGTVAVIAADNGSDYNIAIGALNSAVGIKYPQVLTITNSAAITGGMDTEPEDEAIERAILSYNNQQGLITESDYQNAVANYGGIRAKVLANTNNLLVSEVGSQLILTYGLDATQRTDFLSTIDDRLPVGVTTYIDALPVKTLDISLDIRVKIGSDLPTLAQTIYDLLATKYRPESDQNGTIWQAQVIKIVLGQDEVVSTTQVGLSLDGGTLQYNGDLVLNPDYAEVNLQEVTFNFDDGTVQTQIILS